MKKNIVLINQTSGYLIVDIVNELANKYKSVVFMYGSLELLDVEVNKKVYHSKLIAYNRNSKISRVLTWLWATVQIFFKLLLFYRNYEIIYVTNPPLSYLPSIILRRPFSILVYDIYPDMLSNIGIHENNQFYKLWILLNKKVFSQSKHVFTIGEGMKRRLEKYVASERITVIHNWSHPKYFQPIQKNLNPFAQKHNLCNTFTVLYSGNIGYTHSVDVIVEVAKVLSPEDGIEFLIIGEGRKKQELVQMVKENSLKNCSFLNWQTPEDLPYSLASADLAVVTLNDDTGQLSVPSKTYHLLAVGAPLLCIAPKVSELNNMIVKYNNGACFEKNQVSQIASYVLDLKNDKKKKRVLSNHSSTASLDFTEKNAFKYVEILIENSNCNPSTLV